MPKPRGDVEITSSFSCAFVKLNWWDVFWVNEFVGSWVWIDIIVHTTKHLVRQMLTNITFLQDSFPRRYIVSITK